jgi:hypothetical protein
MSRRALGVFGAVSAVNVFGKKRSQGNGNEETAEDAALSLKERRKVLEALAYVVKEAADTIESGKGEGPAPDTIDVERTQAADTTLSMEVKVTETASEAVQALFADIDQDTSSQFQDDMEQLRLENSKRKYHNAIGSLPFGIPSRELEEWDWIELANALVAGEKQTLPEGGEITNIEGRWYHSDTDDGSTFLKEHVESNQEDQEGYSMEKEDLLAILEERLIMGEISEESYLGLKVKLQS